MNFALNILRVFTRKMSRYFFRGLLNTNKAQALFSFQAENSYIVGIEYIASNIIKSGISRTEVRVLTTELRRLFIYYSIKNKKVV